MTLIYALFCRIRAADVTLARPSPDKLVIRQFGLAGLPADACIVIQDLESDDGAFVVRLEAHGYRLALARGTGPAFRSSEPIRFYRRQRLLAFWTASGTTNFVNFVLLLTHPARLKLVGQFEYPSLLYSSTNERLDEHIRHWDSAEPGQRKAVPNGLYTRRWSWSRTRHRFVVTGHTFIQHWNGWENHTLG